MGDPRPTEGAESQAAQAEQLRETSNGPTSAEESTLLEFEYGPADANGVHGAPKDGGAR